MVGQVNVAIPWLRNGPNQGSPCRGETPGAREVQDHVAPGRLWAEVRASPGEAPRAAAHGDMHQDIRL